MTDDIKIRESSTGRTVRADDIGGKLVQVVKTMIGGDGQNQGFVSDTRGLPVRNQSGNILDVSLGTLGTPSNPIQVELSGGSLVMTPSEPPSFTLTLVSNPAVASLSDEAENLSTVFLQHGGTGEVDLQTLNFAGADRRLVIFRLAPGSSGPVSLGIVSGGNFLLQSDFHLNGPEDALLAMWDGDEWIEVGRSTLSAFDPDAIHDNIAAEISAIAAKTNLSDADIILLEDSAAAFGKKKATIKNLLANIQSAEVVASNTVTTTSLTDVLIPGMSFSVPDTGTYLVMFGMSASHNKSGETVFASIYNGGVQEAGSERQLGGQANNRGNMTCHAYVSATAGDTVEARWRVSSNSGGGQGDSPGPRLISYLRLT